MNDKYSKILIAVVFVVTFVVDVLTPLGYELYFGHVFAVLLAIWIERPNAPYIVAAIATMLLIVEFVLSPPGIPLGMAVFNRIVAGALLWMTAGLVWRAKTAKLDDATRRLGAIVESSSDAILSVTPDGIVTSWNDGAKRLFGYTAAEMLGRSILTIIPANLHDDELRLQAVVQRGQSVRADDVERVTKDGRTIDVSVTLSPLKDAAGRFMGVSKIIRDVSERKRAQVLLKQARESLELTVQERTAELSAANHSLRKLSSRLMQVQEQERSQLARDLHDEIGQLLTALKIDLQAIQHGVAGGMSSSLTDSLELVDRLLTQVRSLALDLRPSLLDDLGLVPALRWYANRQAERNGWNLSFFVNDITERVPTVVEVACFRVAQEALTNTSKYAQAKNVTLDLHRQGQTIMLLIQDDGVGFDVVGARRRAQNGKTIGLLGMDERVRLIGGTMMILSSPGQGASVELVIPLTEQDQSEQSGMVEVMAP